MELTIYLENDHACVRPSTKQVKLLNKGGFPSSSLFFVHAGVYVPSSRGLGLEVYRKYSVWLRRSIKIERFAQDISTSE